MPTALGPAAGAEAGIRLLTGILPAKGLCERFMATRPVVILCSLLLLSRFRAPRRCDAPKGPVEALFRAVSFWGCERQGVSESEKSARKPQESASSIL